MQSERNAHLRSFYALVPALTLCHVESQLLAKDRLLKRMKGGGFTDDGFALGLAYLLRLLGQSEAFEGLRWFEAVSAKFAADKARLGERLHAADRRLSNGGGGGGIGGAAAASGGGTGGGAGGAASAVDDGAHGLALRRLSSYEREFELLYYSYNGARIFLSLEG